MNERKLIFEDGSEGSVSGLLTIPAGSAEANTIVVLAHGAGNDMTSPFLETVAEGLATRGLAVVRFNFPYKERGRGRPDRAPVLEACFRSVLAAVREELGPKRLVIGGKSMGGRMATHLAAAGEPSEGVLLLGYPLHPPGKLDRLRVEHLPNIETSVLFVAGTRDPLSNLDLLRQAIETIPGAVTLHVIEDGDHSFRVLKRTKRTDESVLEEIVEVSARWIDAL